ncbi:carbohydrate ABC transporter permease [Vallitalea longa]|nr:carbohydrate ABC transporter permease [Vallitalea longa]
MTLPTIYMISTSLKPNGALYEYPPRLFPSKATIENYIYVIKEVDFYKNFINSVIVSVSTIAIVALVSSSLAYCISRLNFPGRKFIYVMILSTMIVPGMTLIIPQFELAVFFNMTNKLSGLVPIYVSWVVPFSTFMIKGFIDDVPKEFDEAVFIDGGNILTIYRHIMLPLASPAIATVSIFNFLTVWEEYPWALTVLNDKDVRTLPIAISGFFGQHNFTQWGYVFAMSVISLLPVILIFIFCQKFFVKGLSGGAVKG